LDDKAMMPTREGISSPHTAFVFACALSLSPLGQLFVLVK